MIVYHGSNSRFKQLRIAKNLVKSNSSLLNEGMGIYFSLDKSVAYSYGKYLYTLELNDEYVIDFRKLTACKQYIANVCNYIKDKEGIYINRYFDALSIADYIHYGNVAIYQTCNEIKLMLDSCEAWYNLDTNKINKVLKLLDKYDKEHLTAYLFNYNIKNIGIIKKINPDIVRIMNCEKTR